MSGLVHIPLQKDAAGMEHGIAVDETMENGLRNSHSNVKMLSWEFFQRNTENLSRYEEKWYPSCSYSFKHLFKVYVSG